VHSIFKAVRVARIEGIDARSNGLCMASRRF
jgi:hypothetical protein